MTVFVLSILFLLSRILHLLFWFFPNLYLDAFLTGTLAKDLIEGLNAPFFDYMGTHYSGGNLVYGVCTVPFFLLFGKSAFVFRLASVFFQWGTYLTWYFFMKRFFGERPALYAALLYLFSPPWLTYVATIAGGAHAESLFFTAVGLFLLYKILYEKDHSLKGPLFLGLVCGFGSYYSYHNLVSTLGFSFYWLYKERRLFQKKEFYLFFFSFFVGFSPWVLYNILHQFRGIDLISHTFIYSSPSGIFMIPYRFLKLVTLKIVRVLSPDWLHEASFEPRITLLNLFYYVAILSSYFIVYRFERKKEKAHFLFLFPIFFLLVASMSQFGDHPYFSLYFLPLFPFFFAVIALGLTRLGSFSKRLEKLPFFILIPLLTLGLKGELNLVSPKAFKLSLKYRGYSYYELGGAFVNRYPDRPEKILRLGERASMGLSHPERLALHRGLSNFQYFLERPEEVQQYLLWIKRFDKRYQPLFLTEMGSYWNLSEGLISKRVDSIIKLLNKEDQPYLIEGLIGSFYASQRNPDRIFKESSQWRTKLSPENQRALVYALGKLSWRKSCDASFLEKIKRQNELEQFFPKHLLLYYRGLGALMADSYDPLFREWPFPLEGKLEGIGKDYQEAVYWGAGFEAPLLYEDPFEYERMLKGIPTPYQPFFKQGLQDRLEWGGRNYWIEGKGNLTRRER